MRGDRARDGQAQPQPDAAPAVEEHDSHQEAEAAREHRGKCGAVHAQRRDRPPTEDHDRVEHEVEEHGGTEEHERRAGIARAPERRGDDEVPVDERGAEQLDDEELAGELRHHALRVHEPEDRRQAEDAADGDHHAEHQRHHQRGAGGAGRALRVTFAMPARGHRGEADADKLADRDDDPDRVARERDGGKRVGAERPADPEGTVTLKRSWNSVVPTAGRARRRIAGRRGPSMMPVPEGGAEGRCGIRLLGVEAGGRDDGSR